VRYDGHALQEDDGRAALTNPEAQFEHPMAVAAAAGLTTDGKLAVLDKWAADITQRLDATDEGMTPGPHSPDDAGLMNEIAQAKRAIENPPQR
jgi:hypothetical protein